MESGFDRRWEQAYVEPEPGEEEIEDMKLDEKRDHHWRIIFKDNDVGVENQKAILHVKRWNV